MERPREETKGRDRRGDGIKKNTQERDRRPKIQRGKRGGEKDWRNTVHIWEI
jgi:hypothetical protein